MKYTLEQLREENQGYALGADGITLADLELVNNIIERIEQTRTQQPQELDGVQYTNEYGEYYPNAIIDGDTYHNGGCALCERGSAYVSINNEQNTPRGCISGGAFPQIDKNKLRYIGKQTKRFWTFSTLGAGASQGLYFSADVSLFELNNRAEELRKYTTKDYTRVFVHELREPDEYGYKYTVSESAFPYHAFRTAEELHDYLNRYEAVRESDTDIYWLLQEKNINVWTQEEFDSIKNAEETIEMFNGREVPHKYVKQGTTLLRYILRADERRYTA